MVAKVVDVVATRQFKGITFIVDTYLVTKLNRLDASHLDMLEVVECYKDNTLLVKNQQLNKTFIIDYMLIK